MEDNYIISQKILQEEGQRQGTRKSLYEELEGDIGLPIIAFYTSFKYPVMIEDSDAQMLQDILQSMDFSHGFCLMISSPGGEILSAERIIFFCREDTFPIVDWMGDESAFSFTEPSRKASKVIG